MLRFGVVSETGNVREHNEDNFYIPGHSSLTPDPTKNRTNGSAQGSTATDVPTTTVVVFPAPSSSPPTTEFPVPTSISPEPMNLFVVADGMGGQLAGETASALAVEIIPEQLTKRLGLVPDDEKSLRRAVREVVAEANREILAQAHLVTEFANMGTTVVLVFFRGDRTYVTGIGDSRVYRDRDGVLERLTTDHSLAEALVGAGTIRPEEAENHKYRHVLYNYLGCKDARDGPEEIRVVDVRAGDQYLLASDGLTGVVKDEEIVAVLQEYDDPQRAAQALVDRALQNRSKDNITCIVIRVV